MNELHRAHARMFCKKAAAWQSPRTPKVMAVPMMMPSATYVMPTTMLRGRLRLSGVVCEAISSAVCAPNETVWSCQFTRVVFFPSGCFRSRPKRRQIATRSAKQRPTTPLCCRVTASVRHSGEAGGLFRCQDASGATFLVCADVRRKDPGHRSTRKDGVCSGEVHGQTAMHAGGAGQGASDATPVCSAQRS